MKTNGFQEVQSVFLYIGLYSVYFKTSMSVTTFQSNVTRIPLDILSGGCRGRGRLQYLISLGCFLLGLKAWTYFIFYSELGLDPAGPLFTNTDPSVRLDPTDALFVDGIHSDAVPLHDAGNYTFTGLTIFEYELVFPKWWQQWPMCKKALFKYQFIFLRLTA